MSDFCYYLEKNRFDVNEIKNKKDRVFKKLLKIVKNVNFASITKEIVDNTFFILDEEYFDNKIYKRIKSTGSILKFEVTNMLSTTAGRCDYIYYLDERKRFDYGKFKLIISKKIIDNLFKNNEKSLKINGIVCNNKLECYINLYEHEIIHLLIALFCHNEGKTMGGHTTMFRNIVFNLFGHTEYKHLLLAGYHDKIEKMEEYNKTNIEIGDYVYIRQTKKNAKYITEGTVFKLTNTYVYYEKNGEKLGIRYCNIEKIKKGKDNSNNKLINNNKKLTNEEIIAKLKIGQKVKFRLKTKIEEGTIVSINKSRASIVLQDGKKWYIPYNLFILE